MSQTRIICERCGFVQIYCTCKPMNIKDKNKTEFPQIVEIPTPLEVHPSVSPLAAELLMKTAEVLAKSPKEYCQGNARHECGAPCCIIGHMKRFAGLGACASENQKIHRDCLGLTFSQWQNIYNASCWPTAYSENPTAAEGIARIEHILRTGE